MFEIDLLKVERNVYREGYEKRREIIATYEEVTRTMLEELKSALDSNDELVARLKIANARLSEKDEEVAMLRRDLARHGYGRDNW